MSRVVVFDETGAPEVLRIADEPVGTPGAGEVRLRIEAVGINRLDQMVRTGMSPRPIRLPRARLGVEATGTIDAVGAGVQRWSVGDPVIVTAVPDMDTNGTYAEHLVLPADRIIARPAELDAIGAAALWVAYSTAYGALVEKAAMRPGDHVLITAASSAVGLAAIQIANQIGAIPLAVTRRTAKKDTLLAAGAAAVIVTDHDDVVEATQQHTGGAGADIILDSVMGPGLAELAGAAKPFSGTLVTVGWLDPRPAPYPAGPITMIRYMSFEHTLDPGAVHRIAAFLTAGIRTGALQPTIDTVFTLDDIVAAHHHLEKGTHIGKIVATI
ncbi:zinc-dependent alcohol dehydrogenase family protein [Nocardia cerradoensis]|uniref:zinc-dependent alcohol dehydrogenase family protein n=1 Tax=Nocardia cerradoensis TaxID=85688 RepID=UPI0005850209|nr:zinc-dependent alcohol dehydrogenase family protein [Nocardia cerradoensis]NKY43749.1 zinc-dependent alcohol dehydrogenase family protein [Nocardia cerradoensis]